MPDTGEYPLSKVVAISLRVFLALWSLYKIVLGKFIWKIVPYSLLGLQAIAALQVMQSTPDLAQMAIWLAGVEGLILTITLIVYRDRLSPAQESYGIQSNRINERAVS